MGKPMLSFDISERPDPGKSISLLGSLDSNTSPTLETALNGLFEEALPLLVFDLAGLDYISSAGLRLVYLATKRLHETGGETLLVNPKAQIRKIFEVMNTANTSLFETEAAMNEYLGSPHGRESG